MKILNYNIILRPEPEGGFTVFVPALPGCVSYGKNLTEAKNMARDAVEGYIASLRKHRELIPSDEETFIASIQIKEPVREKASAHA